MELLHFYIIPFILGIFGYITFTDKDWGKFNICCITWVANLIYACSL